MSESSVLKLSDRRKAALRQPVEIFSFSIDKDLVAQFDDRCLSYYYLPDTCLEQRLDLSGGHSEFLAKDETVDHHLNHLLSALIEYEQTISKPVNTSIVTFRGIMTKLMTLVYEKRNDIDLNILQFDGQIFIEEDNESVVSKKRQMNDRDKLMTYWGYKFESLATMNKPWPQMTRDEIESRSNQQVNNLEQYISVVRTGIGSAKLVLGGEVDCVLDYKPASGDGDPLPHYVELKSSSVIFDDKEARKFERKIYKTWAQSFLLGIRHIVYGFRDQNGILVSKEEYKTEQLPVIAKDSTFTNKQSKWNGNESIAFYAAVVEWIVDTVTSEEKDSSVAWRLTYHAGDDQIKLRQLEGQENDRVCNSLLLPEFVEWRKSLR